MSGIKHTPKPWKYGVRKDGSIWLSLGNPELGAHYQGDLVATEADAKLIAAAPDLLADLQEAATTLRRYEALHRAKGTDDSTAKAEVNAALAALFEATIAKATN